MILGVTIVVEVVPVLECTLVLVAMLGGVLATLWMFDAVGVEVELRPIATSWFWVQMHFWHEHSAQRLGHNHSAAIAMR